MPLRIRATVPPLIVVLLSASSLCYADIYTWTDANGRVNISNLAPPEGVRVTNVMRETPRTQAQIEAAQEAARRAEVQALSDRVRQLEAEAEMSRRPMSVPVPVPIMPPQPMMQYPDMQPPV